MASLRMLEGGFFLFRRGGVEALRRVGVEESRS
jgi:hypothetical protein